MQPDRDHHQVRGPAVHVAQQLPEGNIVLEVEHVTKRLHFAGMVIEHLQHAGKGEHNKQVKRDSAHAPGIAIAHRVPVDLRRMQMKENVGQHPQSAVARRVVMLVPEDRSKDLSFGWILQAFNLLFGFCWQVGLKRLDIVLNSSLDAFEQTDLFAVLAVSILFFRHCFLLFYFLKLATRARRPRTQLLRPQECSVVIELARLPFWPLIEPRNIHKDLSVRRDFDFSSIHGTRGGTLEVNSFAVVSAAVTRTLEFVFARLPVRSATQMSAARVNHEDAIGRPVYPDAVSLLELGVHAQPILLGIADLEAGCRLEQSTGQKETEKGNEPRDQKTNDCAPHQSPALLINFAVFRADRCDSTRCRRLRCSNCGSTDVRTRGSAAGYRCSCRSCSRCRPRRGSSWCRRRNVCCRSGCRWFAEQSSHLRVVECGQTFATSPRLLCRDGRLTPLPSFGNPFRDIRADRSRRDDGLRRGCSRRRRGCRCACFDWLSQQCCNF